MSEGQIRFTFMSFVFSVVLGLLLSVVEGDAPNRKTLFLRLSYAVPALLLMVDWWLQFSRYHQGGNLLYGDRQLFLDTGLLVLIYVGLSTLKGSPPSGDTALAEYPGSRFWIALIGYSVVKLFRAWPMLVPPVAGALSWYSLLHILFLAMIILGWIWQKHQHQRMPFWYSGFLFIIVVTLYLLAVYVAKWDPLTPVSGA